MRAVIAVILVIVGIVGIVVGVMYLTEQAHSLPSFFPGHLVGGTGKHTERGLVAVIVGAVLLVIGIVVAVTARARRREFW